MLWLAVRPDISLLVFGNLPNWKVRSLMIALFRKNSYLPPLVDDNALLSGLKEPVEEEKDTFLRIGCEAKKHKYDIVSA